MAKRDDRFYVQVTLDVFSPTGKLAGTGPAAKTLWFAGLVVSRRDLSDGIIRPGSAAAEAEVPVRHTKVLVERGCWHEPGHACGRCVQPPVGMVVIHDFLEHNQSAADVEELKAKRSAAGRAGADARWHGKPDSKSHGKSHGNRLWQNDAIPIAESESESESLVTSSRHLTSVAGGLDDDDLDKIAAAVAGDRPHAARVAADVLSRATRHPRNPVAYVLRAVGEDPGRYKPTRRNVRTPAEECPTHPGQFAAACNGCAADRKAAR